MNRVRKEALKEQMDRLDPHEHAQLFAIVKRYADVYTQTQGGVLVSSDNLPLECLMEMERMVLFYHDQRKRMEGDAAERKAMERR